MMQGSRVNSHGFGICSIRIEIMVCLIEESIKVASGLRNERLVSVVVSLFVSLLSCAAKLYIQMSSDRVHFHILGAFKTLNGIVVL